MSLKLRLSVGAVGQQDIGGYKIDYFKQYDVSTNAYYQFVQERIHIT